MRFNVNDYVRVRLTEKGHEIMRKEHEALRDAFPGVFDEFKEKKADEQGWSNWQLWQLMKTFGPHIKMGMPIPFETEIDIPQKGK